MILSIKNISHSFGDVSIFKDFSFDWKEDIKRISVWGLNGSGKTTLFKIISGEIKPIKGQIIFQDEDITTLTLFKRNLKGISKTFQIPSPFLGMTVFQNVYLGTLEHEKMIKNEKKKQKIC